MNEMTIQDAIEYFQSFKIDNLNGERIYVYEDAPCGLSGAIMMAEEIMSKYANDESNNNKLANEKAIEALWRYEIVGYDYYYREPIEDVIEAMNIATKTLSNCDEGGGTI